ncbi:murein hydrolase activator EnvC family protein [Thermoleophilum album]|uniref:Murein DD-endopeptidase MepM and murein hydrolase activator NlpD, contain LysM domain n=1 Tax=Thermoleophilum album TaxID=29539 RepID=A0A1H6G1A2_THEAL|nr:M23 family metallopeptidase [Thermoleophilum album]SEH16238.1 Murein DD-endopeptidase MepM and murein hydrolase activator NlpD, contain LysM domain [Thermoleophilum album]
MMRRRFWLPITLGLSAYLVLPLPGLSAPLDERIDRQRAKVERKRQTEGVLTQTIAAQNEKIRGLQGEVRGLQRRQQRLQATLDEKRTELLDVRDRLERARRRLAELREELAVAEDALAARLVEAYKTDEPDVLTVVLNADGFGDLLERVEFLDRISDQDQRIVGRVRTAKARAQRQAEQLLTLERRAEDAAQTILARRNEIAAVRKRVVRRRTNLQEARDRRQATLARVRSSRRRAQEDLRALEAEQARVEAALRRAAQERTSASPPVPGNPPAAPIRRGSGRLIWPINGPLTSPFGPRWGRQHAGIDISAPEDTPIRAADSGRVVIAGWMGGYGNYTCIQHTGSLSTCYAHQSRLGTSQGASVRQGQVMGYVGNTGNSFGAHLHFEVRVNGSPVDPFGYL